MELSAQCSRMLPLEFPLSLRGALLPSGNLDGKDHAAERTVEDVFLQKFMLGTFPGYLADPLILKRQAHQLEVCALVLRQLPAHKFHLLVGYSETLLSPCDKHPVCTSRLCPPRSCISTSKTVSFLHQAVAWEGRNRVGKE